MSRFYKIFVIFFAISIALLATALLVKKRYHEDLLTKATKSQLVVAPGLSSKPEVAKPAVSEQLAGAGIASGRKTGTNWPVVEDIIRVCSTGKFPLRNVQSNGTEDNINLVYSDQNSQFGIAQVDGLLAQKKTDPRMMAQLYAVFPLFSVEVHAVTATGSEIRSLADMEGKRVIEGPVGSGTHVTTQALKQLTGIRWQVVPGNLQQAEAIEADKTGAADVAFIVAGKPIRVLTSSSSGLRLVPIEHEKLDGGATYMKTLIPSGTYPWQGEAVRTYKVRTALITYAYKSQYQAEIKSLVTCLATNIEVLRSTGHPKWRDVDVSPSSFDELQWPVHPAAMAAIKETSAK